jgi:hypothetical protein
MRTDRQRDDNRRIFSFQLLTFLKSVAKISFAFFEGERVAEDIVIIS